MESLTFAHQYLNQQIDLDQIEMESTDREHHRKNIQKGKETLVELDKAEENQARLVAMKEKAKVDLGVLEGALPAMILSFGKGEVKHSQVVEQRAKIEKIKALIADLDGAHLMLEDSISRTPIKHAMTSMDQVIYLRDKQAKKKAMEAKG